MLKRREQPKKQTRARHDNSSCSSNHHQHQQDGMNPRQANNAHRPKESSTRDAEDSFLFASNPGGHAAAMHRPHWHTHRPKEEAQRAPIPPYKKFYGGCNPATPSVPVAGVPIAASVMQSLLSMQLCGVTVKRWEGRLTAKLPPPLSNHATRKSSLGAHTDSSRPPATLAQLPSRSLPDRQHAITHTAHRSPSPRAMVLRTPRTRRT